MIKCDVAVVLASAVTFAVDCSCWFGIELPLRFRPPSNTAARPGCSSNSFASSHFIGTSLNADKLGYELTQELLAGKHADLGRDCLK